MPTTSSLAQRGTRSRRTRSTCGSTSSVVKPSLLSYDHYQFAQNGDNPDYFLNLMMIRRTALDARVPFLNIVQACTWTPSMRVPGPDELRYLVYTTLAYGGQGHFLLRVYGRRAQRRHRVWLTARPRRCMHALKSLNREFVAIAKELQPLRSLAVYHAGMSPPGAEMLPAKAPFRFDPPIAPMAYKPARTCSRIPARVLRHGGQAKSCGGRQPGLQGRGRKLVWSGQAAWIALTRNPANGSMGTLNGSNSNSSRERACSCGPRHCPSMRHLIVKLSSEIRKIAAGL